jgi:hypothetical protein
MDRRRLSAPKDVIEIVTKQTLRSFAKEPVKGQALLQTELSRQA